MGLLILDSVPDDSTFATNALIAFRKACLASIAVDCENAIFYRLLADHAERLIDAYHQVPLDSSVAKRDFDHFRTLVSLANEATDKSADAQIKALNQMASAEFF
jgi:hypothetical protein